MRSKPAELTSQWWRQPDSNQRPSACKADALNQLSYASISNTSKERTRTSDPPASARDALNQLSYASITNTSKEHPQKLYLPNGAANIEVRPHTTSATTNTLPVTSTRSFGAAAERALASAYAAPRQLGMLADQAVRLRPVRQELQHLDPVGCPPCRSSRSPAWAVSPGPRPCPCRSPCPVRCADLHGACVPASRAARTVMPSTL